MDLRWSKLSFIIQQIYIFETMKPTVTVLVLSNHYGLTQFQHRVRCWDYDEVVCFKVISLYRFQLILLVKK